MACFSGKHRSHSKQWIAEQLDIQRVQEKLPRRAMRKQTGAAPPNSKKDQIRERQLPGSYTATGAVLLIHQLYTNRLQPGA